MAVAVHSYAAPLNDFRTPPANVGQRRVLRDGRTRPSRLTGMDSLHHSPTDYEDDQLRRAARTHRLRQRWYSLSASNAGRVLLAVLFVLLLALVLGDWSPRP